MQTLDNVLLGDNGEVTVNGFTLNNCGEVQLTDDQYAEQLDDIYGEVNICGMTYNAGYALQQVDPIAYDMGKSDIEASLTDDIESELDSFIEAIESDLDSYFELMLEDDSDYAQEILFSSIEGGYFEYHHTPGHHDDLSRRLKEYIGLDAQYDKAPNGSITELQGLSFADVKAKALELLQDNPLEYAFLSFTDSYWSSKLAVYSWNIGEVSAPCEAIEGAPTWLIERFNTTTDYTLNNGYAYKCINGLELILNDGVSLFIDAIDALKGE